MSEPQDANPPEIDDAVGQSPPGDEPALARETEHPVAAGSADDAPDRGDSVAEAADPNEASDADGTGTGPRPDLPGGGR